MQKEFIDLAAHELRTPMSRRKHSVKKESKHLILVLNGLLDSQQQHSSNVQLGHSKEETLD